MLESARLVSIIREVEEKEIISIIEGLVEEGIRWFEILLSDGENGMKCYEQAESILKVLGCLYRCRNSKEKRGN